MSGSTRIVVIPLKKLIIMICIIAALIILAAIFIFGGSSSDAAKSTGVNISTSTDTVKKNTSCPTYSPGVYTSSILLNGTPIDIQVTVDSDNINNIEMVNLSESVQTMYPMLNVGSEVNNALTQVQVARGKTELRTRQITSLETTVRSTRLLMQHGTSTYLEVLTAQQGLLSAQLTQVADRFDEIQGIINLYQALGGGRE